jgi:carboxypeptidase D
MCAHHEIVQPYIVKTYFGMTDPPVNLAKVAIGDGTIGSNAVY